MFLVKMVKDGVLYELYSSKGWNDLHKFLVDENKPTKTDVTFKQFTFQGLEIAGLSGCTLNEKEVANIAELIEFRGTEDLHRVFGAINKITNDGKSNELPLALSIAYFEKAILAKSESEAKEIHLNAVKQEISQNLQKLRMKNSPFQNANDTILDLALSSVNWDEFADNYYKNVMVVEPFGKSFLFINANYFQ